MSTRPGLSDCVFTADGRVLPAPPEPGPPCGVEERQELAEGPVERDESEVLPAPPPPPWPSEPTPCCVQGGKVLAAVWEDDQGVRRLALHFDGRSLTAANAREAKVERLGIPAGWREAADRLPQDCGCVGHGGPHWLHMDFMDRESNARLLWPAGEMTLLAFAQAEQRRLQVLGDEMERRGIDRLTTFLGLEEAAQTTTPERARR